ncbi:hypothetical protein CL628_04000, partial [bacterium]|nr:hypothetical protein [bacterium]
STGLRGRRGGGVLAAAARGAGFARLAAGLGAETVARLPEPRSGRSLRLVGWILYRLRTSHRIRFSAPDCFLLFFISKQGRYA